MFANLFRGLIALLLIVLGALLVLVGAVGALSSKDESSRNVGYGCIVVGVLLALYGWKRGRNQKRSTSWRNDPATDKQKEFARDLGIKYPKNITKGELSDMISEITGE